MLIEYPRWLQDAFIVDAINGGVFVWVGKECTQQERQKALQFGESYIVQQKRPPWSQVARVLEGTEPASFTQWFSEWTDASRSVRANIFIPRLYQCSDVSGKLHIEEIYDFSQEV